MTYQMLLVMEDGQQMELIYTGRTDAEAQAFQTFLARKLTGLKELRVRPSVHFKGATFEAWDTYILPPDARIVGTKPDESKPQQARPAG